MKCTTAGRQCTGYGQLLRWSDDVVNPGNRKLRQPTEGSKVAGKRPRRQISRVEPVLPSTQISEKQDKSTFWSGSKDISKIQLQLSLPLLDPSVKDFSHTDRYYLSHFHNRLCQDLVTYDIPSHNPYRNLISLTRDHAFLLQAVIANSAIHLSNLHSSPPSLELCSSGGGTAKSITTAADKVSQLRRDAFNAEQKALQALREAPQPTRGVERDVILSTILLFINFELMSSGKNRWKVHVEGARKIIANFQPHKESADTETGMLHDYVVADCLIYYVLGSAFSSPKPDSESDKQHLKLIEMLERGELNSYLSCPAGFLQIILLASHFSRPVQNPLHNRSAGDGGFQLQRGLELMNKVNSFDLNAWAAGVQGLALQNDYPSRLHVASAHRSAICLYINRAVASGALLDETGVQMLVADTIDHLSYIRPGNHLLKSTSWPTFIAGIEARDPKQQRWAVEHLSALWGMLPWGYIHTAVEMLAMTWGLNAADRVNKAVRRESWPKLLFGKDWIVV
ncbi:uncharacterized protein A1O9_03575 [Exophiala aquamarina CBS 119918]|uniref:Acriflavine sensitivity control protein acr-2 n=1 Tax=Exophiala aquamarina CBS 119918 TaxID=1182545 RepID=A0A072PRP2_9EURO|nr:uncharacterized protein A1O9_03575 [Exophiala aquamarina CBS 119918]KEF62003.1 hypothetical protein A1O9_03575 [Exophiala aquamarina CBS 119918]